MKKWAAWMVEKVSRLKLKHGRGDGLGTFEPLEFLVVGIHGKWALWRALSLVAVLQSTIPGCRFLSSLRRALKISTTRSTREGLNARAPRSVRPPIRIGTIRPRFHHNLTSEKIIKCRNRNSAGKATDVKRSTRAIVSGNLPGSNPFL